MRSNLSKMGNDLSKIITLYPK